MAGIQSRALRNEESVAVRRAAGLALRRLEAVEAVPDLIEELDDNDQTYRSFIYAILVGLLGTDLDFDSSASASARSLATERLHTHWKKHGPELTEAASLSRLIRALAFPSERAEAFANLSALGPKAAPALIASLGRPGITQNQPDRDAEVAKLLYNLYGVDHGTDRSAWQEWWTREGQQR